MTNADITQPDSDPSAPQTPGGISVPLILAAYKQMLLALFIAALAGIAILLAILFPYFAAYKADPKADEPSVLIVVCIAGLLGALFSSLARIYNVRDLPLAVVRKDLGGLTRGYLFVYSLVPAIIGVIAAAVLYLLFAGKLIEGGLFPTFVCRPPAKAPTDTGCNAFGEFIMNWSPQAATDYAKVIVWGFIAGFAERLVPDTLTTLSNSKPPATAPAADDASDTGDASKQRDNNGVS